jgi:hypothetical protein
MFGSRPATNVDTFFSAVLSSVALPKYWDNQTNKQEGYKNNLLRLIIKVGNLHVLEWAHKKKNILLDEDSCATAARYGRLEIVNKYAHVNGCPWDKWTCICAARGGHFDIIKYAHEHACPWDELTCAIAALWGHLEVVKYGHEHGCSWDERTCSWAAEKGPLEVLKYAHEHGCPWDEGTCWKAAAGGHLDMSIPVLGTISYVHTLKNWLLDLDTWKF